MSHGRGSERTVSSAAHTGVGCEGIQAEPVQGPEAQTSWVRSREGKK